MAKDKVLRYVEERMTIRLGKRDLPDLRFYRYSATRYVVLLSQSSFPLVWLGPLAVADLNMSLDEIIAHLVKLGAKEMKKPKPYRAPLPYYD